MCPSAVGPAFPPSCQAHTVKVLLSNTGGTAERKANPSGLGGSSAYHRTKPWGKLQPPLPASPVPWKGRGQPLDAIPPASLSGAPSAWDRLATLGSGPLVSVPWGDGSHRSTIAHVPNHCVFLERADTIMYSSVNN